jgi:hypothetical protein
MPEVGIKSSLARLQSKPRYEIRNRRMYIPERRVKEERSDQLAERGG